MCSTACLNIKVKQIWAATGTFRAFVCKDRIRHATKVKAGWKMTGGRWNEGQMRKWVLLLWADRRHKPQLLGDSNVRHADCLQRDRKLPVNWCSLYNLHSCRSSHFNDIMSFCFTQSNDWPQRSMWTRVKKTFGHLWIMLLCNESLLQTRPGSHTALNQTRSQSWRMVGRRTVLILTFKSQKSHSGDQENAKVNQTNGTQAFRG